jgi:magnesium transporter
MGKRARKTLAARSEQRRRFDQSIHPHTRPGTIIVPPDALPPILRVTCYGPDDIVDKHNATLDQIRQLRGKYPVMWIDAAGFGDAKLIEDLGQLLTLHYPATTATWRPSN